MLKVGLFKGDAARDILGVNSFNPSVLAHHFQEQAGQPVPQRVNFLVEQAGQPVHKKLIDIGAISRFHSTCNLHHWEDGKSQSALMPITRIIPEIDVKPQYDALCSAKLLEASRFLGFGDWQGGEDVEIGWMGSFS
ncbi:hypothetical protein IQ270_18590 [Microcoleus sp. LEGE 07076]|uniref:hypothetical protein n=1 Tax=Microcoleus sp. LEGE 07076 TaxID=915322 RepID=UPI001882670E|nr:hypothetical protein [Microcoleus sp. LEGE 07076]MBE9186640.1 hypothetical protein [Microcoleus sp. LEGE 07076]